MKGKEIYAIDSNLFLIEEFSLYVYLAALEKPLSNIELFYRRFSYLSLEYLRKTKKIVTGIDFIENTNPSAEKIYDPYELGIPIRYRPKIIENRATTIFDRVYVDVV